MQAQMRHADLLAQRKSVEMRLYEEQDKFDLYQKAGDLVNPLFLQNEATRKQLQIAFDQFENECFASQVLIDFCGPFDDGTRTLLFKNVIDFLEVKLRRETSLPTEEPIVQRWVEMRYPVSQFWKETTVMLSPFEGRWVIVAGLRFCASNFIKKLVARNSIAYVSVKSPHFEQSFLNAVRRNLPVVLFDFDFANPNLLVLRVQEAQLDNRPLASEDIVVRKDFMVYIDVETLPTDKILHLDARLVDLQLSYAIMPELIGLQLFELTKNDTPRLEADLRALNTAISDAEANVTQILLSSGSDIFENRAGQFSLINLGETLRELKKNLQKVRQMHLWLFEEFPTFKMLGKLLTEFFRPFPNQKKLWRLFDAEFESVTRLSSESLYESVRRRLLCVMSVELPVHVRLESMAAAFKLGMDGENCSPVVGHEQSTVTRALSGDCLLLEPLIDGPHVARSLSHSDLSRYGTIAKAGFDLFLANVTDASEGQVFAGQEIGNFVNVSTSRRPVICHMSSSAYQLAAFVFIASLADHFSLMTAVELQQNIVAACQIGKMVATLCCSESELSLVLSAVSAVFAMGVNASEFRLVILCYDMSLDEIRNFSGIVDQCDLFSIDLPMTIKTALSASLSSLVNRKYSPFQAELAFFDAAANILNQATLCSPFPSFYTFRLALLCHKEGVDLAGRFISEYLYEFPDNSLWTGAASARSEYPLPKSFTASAINACLAGFPAWDNPNAFGFPRKSFALFHERLMTPSPEDAPIPPTPANTSDLFRTELFLLTLTKPALSGMGRRLEQVAGADSATVDFSLLLAPEVFVAKLKCRAVVRPGGVRDPVIAIQEGGEGDGVAVRGLMARGAKWARGGFVAALGCTDLPTLQMRVVERQPQMPMADFWCNGSVVMRIGILGTVASGLTVALFPKPI
jgi:hypothetical protein